MIEYAIVNFCSFNFKTKQQQMNDSMNLVRANLSKYKKRLHKKIQIYRNSVLSIQNEMGIGSQNVGFNVDRFKATQPDENYHAETGLITQIDTNAHLFKGSPINGGIKVSISLNPSTMPHKNDQISPKFIKKVDEMDDSELIDEEFKIEEERQEQQ